MYAHITKAIMSGQEIILTLADGSTLSGIPSWGTDRTKVRIKSADMVVLVPLDEINHVTTLLRFK